jgi:hypothetical protein
MRKKTREFPDGMRRKHLRRKKKMPNYRTVPLEIPGKMMLALGKIALDQGMSFAEFIEGILDGYLRQKKVNWKTI